MKAKIFRIIFCIAVVVGTLLGNGAKEKEEIILPSLIIPEMQELETVSDTAAQENIVVKNALGLPLRDDTVLFVSCRKNMYPLEEYEFDSEGRKLRYLPSYGCDYIEYAYDTDGNLVQEVRYELESNGCDAKIKSWVEYSYEEDEAGEILQMGWEYYQDGTLHYETVHDSEGERQKEITYREDGQLWAVREYDSSKRQYWFTDYDEEGNIERQYRSDFDDKGNEILYVEYDAEGNISPVRGCACDPEEVIPYWRYENIYDESGNLLRQIVYDIDGVQTGYVENAYDENANLVEETEYDAKNAEIYHAECTYDQKGNLVERYSFSEEYQERNKTIYEYDGRGNCIERLVIKYTEDEEGNIVEHSPWPIWQGEYDAENRLIRYIDGDGDRYSYKYKEIGTLEEYPYDKIEVH